MLKWAFEGKLTEQWRAQNNPPPASELLEQIKEERETKYKEECARAKKEGKRPPRKPRELPPVSEEELPELPELPEGWEWVRLGHQGLIVDGPQNGLYKPHSAYGTGIPIVRIDDFNSGVIRPWKELRHLALTTEEESVYRLREHDVLVNRVNSMSHLGKCGLARGVRQSCVFESNMMRISLDLQNLASDYLVSYLSSAAGLQQLRRNAKQAVNQASINQTDVRSALVPYCSCQEQTEAVAAVDALLGEAGQLEASVDVALNATRGLRQSILKHAFEGRLVPQDHGGTHDLTEMKNGSPQPQDSAPALGAL